MDNIQPVLEMGFGIAFSIIYISLIIGFIRKIICEFKENWKSKVIIRRIVDLTLLVAGIVLILLRKTDKISDELYGYIFNPVLALFCLLQGIDEYHKNTRWSLWLFILSGIILVYYFIVVL